jgi:two-component SAPR family response regulator
MTTTAIDTRIMNRLKELNTGEKKAVLSLVDNLVKAHDYQWSEEEKEELEELKRQHKTGKLKSYTVAEVRKHALKAIKK